MRRRVLVVEDDAVISAWLQACLETPDWDVVCAYDGQDALQHLNGENGFDLVLLDVWLPEMNGLEVLRTLRVLERACPVIVMTAYEDSFDREHAFELGAVDVLVKPFTAGDLEACINQILSADEVWTPRQLNDGQSGASSFLQ